MKRESEISPAPADPRQSLVEKLSLSAGGVNEASLPAVRDAPGLRVSNGRGVRHQSRHVHRHSHLGHRLPGPRAAWPRSR
jgi:hypothetical protein